MNDFLDIITDPEMGACNFTYLRITEKVNDKGRTERTEISHEAVGNIQPAPGKERELLPEGERDKETIVIYSPAPLRTDSQGKHKADIVLWNNKKYRVAMTEPWQGLADYTKALALAEGN